MKLATFLLIGATSMAGAEEIPSIGFTSIKPTGNFVVQVDRPAAIISADGEVTINWQNVEKIVANANKWDARSLAIARLMLAIRDGTYKSQ
jgi:hypothetical protein